MYFRRFRKQIKEEAREEKTWPIMIVVLVVIYFVFPRTLWPVLTFFLLGFTYFVMVVSEVLEYFFLQKRWINLLYIVIFSLFGIALGIGALLASPNPIVDFSKLRNVSRGIWAVSLPFFAVAAYLKLAWVLRRIREKESPD
jgi:hypothetical protein